jgi:hypothetical protein
MYSIRAVGLDAGDRCRRRWCVGAGQLPCAERDIRAAERMRPKAACCSHLGFLNPACPDSGHVSGWPVSCEHEKAAENPGG